MNNHASDTVTQKSIVRRLCLLSDSLYLQRVNSLSIRCDLVIRWAKRVHFLPFQTDSWMWMELNVTASHPKPRIQLMFNTVMSLKHRPHRTPTPAMARHWAHIALSWDLYFLSSSDLGKNYNFQTVIRNIVLHAWTRDVFSPWLCLA